ncbi:MAG: polysaccharide deacetylase [Lachnospiraceae bacterium]|uniref:polysaccharide deacetylase family protein n=1 Tax=uncultured Acetatifactor sp. TaxID=1671927 RepID=UPI002621967D|nr:polysaccharide deacetylase family protein [uncultured Acetatifactor sp.]MCI8788976.1 polysaccharide deacetylase [Lachnospiraceae bacterium]
MAGRNMSKDSISKAKMPKAGIEEHDIPQTRAQKAAGEKAKRRQKGNIAMLRTSIAIWMLLCAVLLVRIKNLNETIEALKNRTDRLTQIVMDQQDILDQLLQAGSGGQGGNQIGSGAQTGESVQGSGGLSGGQDRYQTGDDGQGLMGTAEWEEEVSAAHKVYLTFDDGPGANTQKILDILDEYDVKATFFVVGKEGSAAEEAMKRIVEDGHTLGMHSYTHSYSQVYESLENFGEDLEKEREYLYEVTGVWSNVYRFPGGSSNTVSKIDMREFARYLDEQGIRFFDWNISSGDGGSYLVPTETLVENCTANIRKYSTSVILMHDAPGKTTTLEALPKIIETIQAMDDTAILPITNGTELIQHIEWQDDRE